MKMMQKAILGAALVGSLSMVGAAHALTWTDWASGTLSHTAGAPTSAGDEVTTDALNCGTSPNPQSYCNDTFTISWDVDYGSNGTWRYTYELTSTTPNLSHWIIQVSDNFTMASVLSGSTAGLELNTYSGANPSNPGMPSPMYGLKWNMSSGSATASTIIISDRMPVWGNIYLKGGNGPFAYNVNWFGTANGTDVTQGSDLFGYIARPDSVGTPPPDDPLPLPSIAWLTFLGLGLLGARRLRTA